MKFGTIREGGHTYLHIIYTNPTNASGRPSPLPMADGIHGEITTALCSGYWPLGLRLYKCVGTTNDEGVIGTVHAVARGIDDVAQAVSGHGFKELLSTKLIEQTLYLHPGLHQLTEVKRGCSKGT